MPHDSGIHRAGRKNTACFSSQSHFSRVFKKYSGYSPSEYRDKYAR
ncbi:MAG: AraC family transcriptional regulator [Lachnospiraceae bacterium]|nr:AraC family transcriptional regulator [Lachnospiraceae bacterium]MBD5506140.1 AraC family transcriptional regulator [Lachnospiraceae bacterium]